MLLNETSQSIIVFQLMNFRLSSASPVCGATATAKLQNGNFVRRPWAVAAMFSTAWQ
jgi:hypothetical protein